jgi:hypothetical protein
MDEKSRYYKVVGDEFGLNTCIFKFKWRFWNKKVFGHGLYLHVLEKCQNKLGKNPNGLLNVVSIFLYRFDQFQVNLLGIASNVRRQK